MYQLYRTLTVDQKLILLYGIVILRGSTISSQSVEFILMVQTEI